MSLTQYYTATTLDGFIADENHSLDWLFTRDQDRAGPLNYAGRSYSFVDRGAPRHAALRYWLQEVKLNAARRCHGPVRSRSA